MLLRFTPYVSGTTYSIEEVVSMQYMDYSESIHHHHVSYSLHMQVHARGQATKCCHKADMFITCMFIRGQAAGAVTKWAIHLSSYRVAGPSREFPTHRGARPPRSHTTHAPCGPRIVHFAEVRQEHIRSVDGADRVEFLRVGTCAPACEHTTQSDVHVMHGEIYVHTTNILEKHVMHCMYVND